MALTMKSVLKENRGIHVVRVQQRNHAAYRAILAAYCAQPAGARWIREAIKVSRQHFSGHMPSVDAVEEWAQGGRKVDGSPWSVLKWSEIAELVDAGELTLDQIRQGGSLEREIRDIVREALKDKEFRERLIKKPEVLIGLWDRAKKAEDVSPELQKLIDDRKAKLAESRGQVIYEDVDTGNKIERTQHNVEDLSDEELRRIMEGQKEPE